MPDDVSDFINIGDEGVIIVTQESAYGEGAYGEGVYGGSSTVIPIGGGETEWTDIYTP